MCRLSGAGQLGTADLFLLALIKYLKETKTHTQTLHTVDIPSRCRQVKMLKRDLTHSRVIASGAGELETESGIRGVAGGGGGGGIVGGAGRRGW